MKRKSGGYENDQTPCLKKMFSYSSDSDRVISLSRKVGKTNLIDVFSTVSTPPALVRNNGDLGYIDQLRGKFVILYVYMEVPYLIERDPLPHLKEIYSQHGPTGSSQCEIVFLWLGKDRKDFDDRFATMPWLAVPPDDLHTVDILKKEFDFPKCEHTLLFDDKGLLICDSAFTTIDAWGAQGFPFTNPKIRQLTEIAENLRRQIRHQPTLPDLNTLLGPHIYSRDGIKVSVSELDAKTVTVGLYFASFGERFRHDMDMLQIMCKVKHFIPIFISNFNHSMFMLNSTKTAAPVPWRLLPHFQGRVLSHVFSGYVTEPFDGLVVLKSDRYQVVSYFAFEIFQTYKEAAYPYTLEAAVRQEKKRQLDRLCLFQILSPKTCLKRGCPHKMEQQESVILSQLTRKCVLLLFGAQCCQLDGKSLFPALKELYMKKRGFEIIYISLDFDRDSFVSSTKEMPWLVHRGNPSYARVLVRRVFGFNPYLRVAAMAAFGEDGYLETKATDLYSKEQLGSEYPFIKPDMDDEVCRELMDCYGWDLANVLHYEREDCYRS